MAASNLRMAATTAVCAGVLLLAACAGWTQTTQAPPAKSKAASRNKVDPHINKQFQKANVKEFVKRFESDDREVFARRQEITDSLKLKPGMSVADVGAGTGVFTRLFAEKVGPEGRVYAVDISKDFLKHIAADARARGQSQVQTVQGTQESTGLPANALDLVFLCDVYHHLESHEKVLASIRQALKPGGTLVLVEFDRVEGRSSDFILKHVRASQAEFRGEIEAAGFTSLPSEGLKLKENFVAKFRKGDPGQGQGKSKAGQRARGPRAAASPRDR